MCLSRTVACQADTSLRRQLWKSYRTMSPTILDSMRVSTWNIPKKREEAISLRSFMGDEFTEIPTCSLNVTNSGYRAPTTVWEVTCETRALLDSTRPHFWRPGTPAASTKQVASLWGSPSLSPRKPIHRMAKAGRWISRDKRGGESPIRSCQVCATAGSMAVEPCSRSCRISKGMYRQGSPDIAWQYPPDHVLEYTEFGNAGPEGAWWVSSEMISILCSFSVHQAFACGRQTTPLATEAASSMFPYCCPSSSRKRSTLLIQSATGLNCWLHSCWKPPSHPMRSDFCRMTWFRLEGSMSSGV